MRAAEQGITHLRGAADTLVILSNDKLLQICDKAMPMEAAFLVADDLLRQARRSRAPLRFCRSRVSIVSRWPY
jgi:cell division protein FtsZ